MNRVTPTSSAASTPKTDASSGSSLKRRHDDRDTGSPNAKRPALNQNSRPSEEEAKLQATLDRLATEAGDEKWTLESPSQASRTASIIVENIGYGQIDASKTLINNSPAREAQDGRKTFGGYKRKQVQVRRVRMCYCKKFGQYHAPESK